MTNVDPLAPPPGDRVASLPANTPASVSVPTLTNNSDTTTPDATDDQDPILKDLETALAPKPEPPQAGDGTGGSEGGGDPAPSDGEGEGQGATDATTDDGTSPPETPELIDIGGQKYTAEQLQVLTQLGVWAQQLTPQHLEAIDALFSGQYTLAPAQSLTGAPAPGVGTTTPTPGAPSSEPTPEINYEEWDDPNIAKAFQALQSKLTNIESFVQTEAQRRYDEQMAQVRAGIQTATESFKTEYSLTDEEITSLSLSVQRSGIIPALAATQPPEAAMKSALTLAFYQDPQYRQKIIDKELAAEKEKTKAENARKSKAAAVSGASGGIPRPTQPINTKEQREAALVAEIENAVTNGRT